jgi:hypothetical protein
MGRLTPDSYSRLSDLWPIEGQRSLAVERISFTDQ